MKDNKIKDIKDKIGDLKKYKTKNKANFWGFVLAIACFFLAVVVPLTITNNEVRAAKEAAAAEAQRAFEEAKQAALEAERKAEEERMLAMNQALAEQRAAEEKAEQERLAAEKAAQEREELLSEINKRTQDTVSSIVLNQMEEDFNTQYAIKDTLIESQSGTISFYEDYLNKQTNRIMNVVDEVNESVEKVKETVDNVNDYVSDIQEEQRRVRNAHFFDRNRVEIVFSGAGSVTDFDSNTTISGKVVLSASYFRKITKAVSMGGSFAFDNPKGLSFRFMTSFIVLDKEKFNLNLKVGAGARYSFSDQKLTGLFSASAGLRYTLSDGYELMLEPTVALSTDFKEINRLCFMPLTVGMSFTF